MTRDEAVNLLGLTGSPTAQEIIKAYHEKARKYHPDLYATAGDAVKEVMHEKMQSINEARDMLFKQSRTSAGAPENDAAAYQRDLVQAETLMGRRQFNEALQLLESLENRFGQSPHLLMIRANVYQEMGRFRDALSQLQILEGLDASLAKDPDYLHQKAAIACEAGLHGQALDTIDKALSITRAPAFLATKAMIFIAEGNAGKADRVINELKAVDPNHPLVKERQQVYNVGGTYMHKQEAKQNACCLCIVLELLFDCL